MFNEFFAPCMGVDFDDNRKAVLDFAAFQRTEKVNRNTSRYFAYFSFYYTPRLLIDAPLLLLFL